MASISSAGIGSGLDINGIIKQLMTVEQQPLAVLAQKEAGLQARLSAFGSLKGAISSLQSAVKTLTTASTFTGMSASSSDNATVAASASSSATAGTYNISVTQRAKYHSLGSLTPYAATTDTFTTGTLAITVGGTTTNVTIDGTNNTLAGLKTAINDAKAGVTASIVNTGTTNRLVLISNTTGSTGAMTVAVTDSGAGGTHPLADLDSAGLGMEVLQPAQDAQLTINNVAITRSSNTITDAIEGVTLTLAKDSGSATVTVTQNTGAVRSAVDAFVKAYNETVKLMREMTAYNSETRQASVLTGDSGARSLQSALRGMIATTVTVSPTATVKTLSDVGITLQRDGTLQTNAAKLESALSKSPADVAALFSSDTSAVKGVAVQMHASLTSILGSKGLLASRTDGINSSIETLNERREALERRLVAIEKRYRTQFTALDSLVSSMQSTSQYLQQQLANLPKSNG